MREQLVATCLQDCQADRGASERAPRRRGRRSAASSPGAPAPWARRSSRSKPVRSAAERSAGDAAARTSERGADRNRTGVHGFAGRCVATPPRRRGRRHGRARRAGGPGPVGSPCMAEGSKGTGLGVAAAALAARRRVAPARRRWPAARRAASAALVAGERRWSRELAGELAAPAAAARRRWAGATTCATWSCAPPCSCSAPRRACCSRARTPTATATSTWSAPTASSAIRSTTRSRSASRASCSSATRRCARTSRRPAASCAASRPCPCTCSTASRASSCAATGPGGFADLDDDVLVALGDHAGAALHAQQLHRELRDVHRGRAPPARRAPGRERPAPRRRWPRRRRRSPPRSPAGCTWSAVERDATVAAAALADIGMLAMPAAVLDRAGPLTSEERAAMQRHPGRSASTSSARSATCATWPSASSTTTSATTARAIPPA